MPVSANHPPGVSTTSASHFFHNNQSLLQPQSHAHLSNYAPENFLSLTCAQFKPLEAGPNLLTDNLKVVRAVPIALGLARLF